MITYLVFERMGRTFNLAVLWAVHSIGKVGAGAGDLGAGDEGDMDSGGNGSMYKGNIGRV